MNTPNNKRFINSQENMENAFIKLLATHNKKKITVQSICNLANVNRTTFYAHYTDIYDLQKQIEKRLSAQLEKIFQEALYDEKKMNSALCKMFYFIKKHNIFYKVFLEYNNTIPILKTILCCIGSNTNDKDSPNYHIAFFTAGVCEMIRIWLNNDCREKPEELARIIYEEYH